MTTYESDTGQIWKSWNWAIQTVVKKIKNTDMGKKNLIWVAFPCSLNKLFVAPESKLHRSKNAWLKQKKTSNRTLHDNSNPWLRCVKALKKSLLQKHTDIFRKDSSDMESNFSDRYLGPQISSPSLGMRIVKFKKNRRCKMLHWSSQMVLRNSPCEDDKYHGDEREYVVIILGHVLKNP